MINQNKWKITDEVGGVKTIQIVDINDLRETLTPKYLNSKADGQQIKIERFEDADEYGSYRWTEIDWFRYIEYGGVTFTAHFINKVDGTIESDDEDIYIDVSPELMDAVNRAIDDYCYFYAHEIWENNNN